MNYKKTQIGWTAIGLFISIISLLFLSYMFQWGNPPTFNEFVTYSIIFLIIILLFYKLTIKLSDSALKVIFGIGIIRFNIQIDKLIDVRVIKTPWYYGIGIRITSEGMLYNIRWGHAVEIKYISKGKSKTVMVGSANPLELKNVLESYPLINKSPLK